MDLRGSKTAILIFLFVFLEVEWVVKNATLPRLGWQLLSGNACSDTLGSPQLLATPRYHRA